MLLFDRVIELHIGDTLIESLHISFEIEKDESPNPNSCHIEIFNLSPENRAKLSRYSYVPVLLKAGYKGNVSVIFEGDLACCYHIHEDASWKTILTSGEGFIAISSKRTNKSYAKGTPIKTVIKDLAQQMGLPLMNTLNHIKDLKRALSKDFAAISSPIKDIARLVGKDFCVSVQRQSLQIRKSDEALPQEALSLSSESGLLGSPEPGSKGEIIVRALLIPELNPGRKVHIKSSSFEGFLTIESVRFNGSNFGELWEAEVVGRIN